MTPTILGADGREVGEAGILNALNDWMHQPKIMTVAATELGPHVYELGIKVFEARTQKLATVSSAGRSKVPLAPGEAKSIVRELLSSRVVRQQIARYIERQYRMPRMSVMRQLFEMAEECGLDTTGGQNPPQTQGVIA